MSYAVKGAPFRYSGAKNVEDCKTAQDVMIKAGLNWNVEKCELVAKIPANSIRDIDLDAGFINGTDFYKECPNSYATFRTDCGLPLGVVKAKYTPVQNMEAFTFFNDAIGKDKAIWQTAGFFGNGETIFVSAKLPKGIFVKGDPVDNYLIFTTSHDGSSGVKILFSPIRVVCQNTLNAAIRHAKNYVSFRHTSSVHENINIAKEILGICNTNINYLSEAYNYMNEIKANDEFAVQSFANVVLTEQEQKNIIDTGHTIKQIIYRNIDAIQDSKISMKKVNTLTEMNNYYFTGPGQRQILGTNWGVYNAVTGYYSNVDKAEGEKRMSSLMFGDKSKKIEKAGMLLSI